MLIFNTQLQEKYQKEDNILHQINSVAHPEDARFTSHRWLLESLPKRMIYNYMYGDLLEPTSPPKQILDVGGGYTALTRLLLQNHNYFNVDIMAHDDHRFFMSLQIALDKTFWINADWNQFIPNDRYDLVIANDLFPNVDQRLEIFLDKYLPICSELRLSLTFYNTPRWYQVKRIDGDEVFHMMAWDGIQVRRVLEKYNDRIQEPQLDTLLQNPPSLFANGRQVCIVTLRGEVTE